MLTSPGTALIMPLIGSMKVLLWASILAELMTESGTGTNL